TRATKACTGRQFRGAMRALTLWHPLRGFNPFQNLLDRNTNSQKINDFAFASISRCRHDSCDARMGQEKNLHNDGSSLIGHFAADTFNFFLTVLAQEVEAHAVALCLLDVVVLTPGRDRRSRAGKVSWEDSVLHPCGKTLHNAMAACTTRMISQVIGLHEAHRAPFWGPGTIDAARSPTMSQG